MFPIIPQLPELTSDIAGELKTAIIAFGDGATGLSRPAPSGINAIVGSWSGTVGQYLFLSFKTTSGYINAAHLYDSTTNTITTLTISGALAESVADGAQCSLTYSIEQGKFYLLSGSAAVLKVYPLTLSGTTLTVGTAIDLSAGFTSKGSKILMTSDKTDLYLLDVADGGFKKYDLSAGSLGSALTAPTSGYYTTLNKYANFYYSNGKIYFLTTTAATGRNSIFQVYNIAGNSWSDLTITPQLAAHKTAETSMLADPDDNTELYFWNGIATAAQDIQCQLIKYTVATETEVIELNTMPCSAYAFQVAGTGYAGLGRSAAYTDYIPCRMGVLDISNGDIVNIDMASGSVVNYGTNFAKKEVFSYTGAGYLIGLASLMDSAGIGGNTGRSLLINRTVKFFVTIDGGTEYELEIGDAVQDDIFNSFKLSFSTSISIKAIAGQSGISSALKGLTTATVFLIITS